ncbi:MAG: ATP synthase F1 subunit delta [Thermaerobacterales bacterium]
MINRTIARRYAAAFYQAADGAGVVDEAGDRLSALVDVLNEQPRVRRVIENRRLPRSDREQLLMDILGGDPPGILVNLLRLLVEKRREIYIEDIYREYHLATLSARNIAEARVTTAVELGPDAAERIRTRLEEITGQKIRILPEIDPAVVGGLLVRIGDRRLDGSLRRQLHELRQDIAGRGGRDEKGVLVR